MTQVNDGRAGEGIFLCGLIWALKLSSTRAACGLVVLMSIVVLLGSSAAPLILYP